VNNGLSLELILAMFGNTNKTTTVTVCRFKKGKYCLTPQFPQQTNF